MESTIHETARALSRRDSARAYNPRIASPWLFKNKRQLSATTIHNNAFELMKSPNAKKKSKIHSPTIFFKKPPIAKKNPSVTKKASKTRYKDATDTDSDKIPLLTDKAKKPPLYHLDSKDKLRKEQGKVISRLARYCFSPKPIHNRTVTLNNSTNLIEKTTIADYEILEEIGKGSYAVVKKAIRKTDNKIVAMKIYEKQKLLDPHRKKVVNREIQILKKLSHPNIVKLYEVIDSTKKLYLIMEYVKGQTLSSYLKSKKDNKLSESEIKLLFKQILCGIQYCHKSNIVHRDIKLENILITEDCIIKIIDFGFSTCSPINTKSYIFCGTPSYMAPEIVSRVDYCGPPVDMWALGVLLYIVTIGRYPFKGANSDDLYSRINRGMFSLSSQVPINCRLLIRKLLQVDPDKRPTCDEALKEPLLRFNRDILFSLRRQGSDISSQE